MNPTKKIVYMQRVLNPRGARTSADIEKENFERSMFESLNKAINPIECPPKEKHVRKLLIGTYQVKSGHFFWEMSPVLKLQENPIICWKFCHVLHKLLRDGHRQVVADSYGHRQVLVDCGRMWKHMDGYGLIIKYFCQLLFNRMNFYIRNPRFPTDLKLTDEELEAIGENDVNIYFQLDCELMDLLDDILTLQEAVLGSLKLKSSSSLTTTGQCRLAPLTSCIQDSSLLYDYSVKILFKLHAQLPVGTLEGHRDRFMSQYNALKQFYLNTGSLQYFKNLIQIPRLTDKPPNFLIASDLNDHVRPHVVVITSPGERDSPELSNNSEGLLIDISSQDDENDSRFGESSHNTSLVDSPQDKDELIQHLRQTVDQLNTEIQFVRFEEARTIKNMSSKIDELSEKLEQSASNHSLPVAPQPIDTLDSVIRAEEYAKLADMTGKFEELKMNYQQLENDNVRLKRDNEINRNAMADHKKNLDLILKDKATLEVQVKLLENKLSEHAKLANFQESSREESKKLAAQLDLKDKELNKVKNEILQIKANNDRHVIDSDNRSRKMLEEKEKKILEVVLESEISLIEGLSSKSDESISMVGISNLNHFIGLIQYTEIDLKNLSDYLKQPSNPDTAAMIDPIIKYFTRVCHLYLRAVAIYETRSDIDASQDIMTKGRTLIEDSLSLAKSLYKSDASIKKDDIVQLINQLNQNLYQVKLLISSCIKSDKKPDNLEEQLTKELNETDKIIKEAAVRIEQLTANSRKLDTGIKLEVNSKISDVCSNLMHAVMELILKSRNLQKEIVCGGNSSAQNVRDFYQRNSSWTEGLISAANVVAMAAKLLVDSADRIMTSGGKFTELAAAAHEIAAATTQLVVASRVKAKQHSEGLKSLVQSSKQVNLATGNVVATARVCAQLVEQESEKIDISSLSLHQTKKLEMETQVKLLELESELTRERIKLGALRKQHYDIQPE